MPDETAGAPVNPSVLNQAGNILEPQVSPSQGKSRRKMIFGALAVLLLVGGVAAAALLVQQRQLINQEASVTGIGRYYNDFYRAVGVNEPCDDSGCTVPTSCVVYKDTNGDGIGEDVGLGTPYGVLQECDESGSTPCTNVTSSAGAGQRLNLPSLSCGRAQIDIGCQNANGVATIGYVGTSAASSCTTTTTTTDTLPQGSCPSGGICVPSSYWPSGFTNCGAVGRPDGPAPGQSCTGGFCCGPLTTSTGSTPTPTPQPVCGESCQTDNDCADATIPGVTTACVNNKCVNKQCSDSGGETVFGTRCDCVLPHACGAPCGAGIGLCDAGFSCTYTAQSQCSPSNTGVCVPTGTDATTGRGPMTGVPEYQGATFERTRCGATTADANNSYISHPSFPNHTFTSAEVAQYICNPVPEVTPSPPPQATAQCTAIKIYDTDFNQILAADLPNLKAGDIIRVAVLGTTTEGAFDQARFTINGNLRPPVTTVKSDTNEFYDEYTIPEGVTDFTIKAELHHPTLGWF